MKKLLLLLVLFSISNFAQVKIEIIGNYFVASTANTNLINVDKTRIQFECFDTSNPTSRYYFLIDKVRNNTPYFWTVFRTSTNAAFASQAALNTWLYENTGTTSGAGSSAPLPSGAATEVTLNTLFKAGQNIGNTAFGISGTLPAFATTPTVNAGTGFQNNALTDTQLRASPLPVTGVFFPTTQPISATSLPLPTGAATSTNQDRKSVV